VLIIKRWVPDYERNFLWDHSQAIRESRGRQRSRDSRRDLNDPQKKRNLSEREYPNAWVLPMFHAFSSKLDPEVRRENLQEGFKGLAHRIADNMARKKEEQMFREQDGYYRPQRQTFGEVNYRMDRQADSNNAYLTPVSHTRPDYISQKSAPNVPTTTSTGRRRRGSVDSIHSAPDVEEVTLRRQRSRSLSRSGERIPIIQTSGEFSRQPSYHEREMYRLQDFSRSRPNSKTRTVTRIIRAAGEVYLAQKFRENDRMGRSAGGAGRQYNDAESVYADTESQYAETEWQYDEAREDFVTADRQYTDAGTHYDDVDRHYSDTERQYAIAGTRSSDTSRRSSKTDQTYTGIYHRRHSDTYGCSNSAERHDAWPSLATQNVQRPAYMSTAPRYDPYPKSPQYERRFTRLTDS
jgi:hypothetical protein